MRLPGQGGDVSFRVYLRLDGASEATVTIHPVQGGFLFSVRPKGKRREYTLSLAQVAEIVAWRVAKIETL